MKIPKWLKLQEQIDLRYFLLNKMLQESKSRIPIEVMIDQATGMDKKKLKEAEKLMKEIDKLKAEYAKEVK